MSQQSLPQATELPELQYGSRVLKHYVPSGIAVTVLTNREIKPSFTNIETRLQEVLERPLGMTQSFSEFVKAHHENDKDVIIVIDDYTRPNRHTRILLPLIEKKLVELGVKPERIKLLIATGTHRAPTDAEIKKKILQHLYMHWKDRILVHLSNDPTQIRDLGFKSSRGTPLTLNFKAVNAAFLIAIGDPEYHYFAGIAGNSKLIVPGIAGDVTIKKNHPLMFEYGVGFRPECRLGNMENNPVIQDILELVKHVAEHVVPIFSIQAVEQQERIVWLEAGDIIAVHHASASILKQVREIQIEQPADIVIVGTENLGLNLFQAGKAVHAGWNAVKKDGRGIIIVVAPCTDGVGNDRYEDIMHAVKGMRTVEALDYVIDHYCTEKTFVMGNHKPVDQLRVLKDVDSVYFLTEFDKNELESVYRFKKIPMINNDPELSLRVFLERLMSEKKSSLVYVLPDPGFLVVAGEQ